MGISGLGGFAAGLSSGLITGKRVRDAWDEREAGEAFKKGATQNVADVADTDLQAAHQEAAAISLEPVQGRNGQMHTPEDARERSQEYTDAIPNLTKKQYALGDKTQDAEFTPSQRRNAGLYAQADYWASKGKGEKSADLIDKADVLTEREYQLGERNKKSSMVERLRSEEAMYGAGKQAIEAGKWDDPALAPMIEAYNANKGWGADGKTGQVVQKVGGQWMLAQTDADGKVTESPFTPAQAHSSWNSYMRNRLDGAYREIDPVRGYEGRLASEAKAAERAFDESKLTRKEKLEELKEDGRERRLLMTLGQKTAGVGSGSSGKSKGGAADFSVNGPDLAALEDTMKVVKDMVPDDGLPGGVDADKNAVSIPKAEAQTQIMRNASILAPANKGMSPAILADYAIKMTQAAAGKEFLVKGQAGERAYVLDLGYDKDGVPLPFVRDEAGNRIPVKASPAEIQSRIDPAKRMAADRQLATTLISGREGQELIKTMGTEKGRSLAKMLTLGQDTEVDALGQQGGVANLSGKIRALYATESFESPLLVNSPLGQYRQAMQADSASRSAGKPAGGEGGPADKESFGYRFGQSVRKNVLGPSAGIAGSTVDAALYPTKKGIDALKYAGRGLGNFARGITN